MNEIDSDYIDFSILLLLYYLVRPLIYFSYIA